MRLVLLGCHAVCVRRGAEGTRWADELTFRVPLRRRRRRRTPHKVISRWLDSFPRFLLCFSSSGLPSRQPTSSATAMVRPLRVAAAQVGRIDRGTPRAAVISRLNALLDQAAERGVKLAVFPETTFSTFFPRYWIEDQAEIASYFEKEPVEGIACCETVKAFFDKAATLGVDVAIGYGEETPDGTRFNTASYVSDRKTVGKYRKVHLPGASSGCSTLSSRLVVRRQALSELTDFLPPHRYLRAVQ